MNRFINSLLLALFFPTLLLAIFIGFDLPIGFLKTSGAQLGYRFEILLGLGTFILVLNLRRSVRRWTGSWMLRKKDRFLYNEPVSSKRRKRVVVYLLLEAFVMSFLAAALYRLSHEVWMPAIGFLFGALDSVVFCIVGSSGKYFRTGISSKALIVADREVPVLYFEGLRKITLQQQTIYFDYIKDLQLSVPVDVIDEANKERFKTVLLAQTDPDRVFVNEHFKNL